MCHEIHFSCIYLEVTECVSGCKPSSLIFILLVLSLELLSPAAGIVQGGNLILGVPVHEKGCVRGYHWLGHTLCLRGGLNLTSCLLAFSCPTCTRNNAPLSWIMAIWDSCYLRCVGVATIQPFIHSEGRHVVVVLLRPLKESEFLDDKTAKSKDCCFFSSLFHVNIYKL